MHRAVTAGLCLGIVTGAAIYGSGAAGASTPVGGAIQVWGTPASNGGGSVVLTGAIADSGKSVHANSSGKPSKKGIFTLLELKKGTILVNTTQLDKDVNNASLTGGTFNNTTCSGYVPTTDPVPVVEGTKAYKGISGSVSITLTFAVVVPLQKGKCNLSQSGPNPSAQYGSTVGTGTVTFSAAG
jgi:hypothetical protein